MELYHRKPIYFRIFLIETFSSVSSLQNLLFSSSSTSLSTLRFSFIGNETKTIKPHLMIKSSQRLKFMQIISTRIGVKADGYLPSHELRIKINK